MGQEFAISKNIELGDEKGLTFPSVWDWALQFSAQDRSLFLNPAYVGKSAPCLQRARPSRRPKVGPGRHLRHTLLEHTCWSPPRGFEKLGGGYGKTGH